MNSLVELIVAPDPKDLSRMESRCDYRNKGKEDWRQLLCYCCPLVEAGRMAAVVTHNT